MKSNAIVRIVLFSLVILILLGILLAGFAVRFAVTNIGSFVSEIMEKLDIQNRFMDGGTISQAGSVDAGKIRDISIDWVSGSIILQPGDTDTITFAESEVSEEKYQMVWKQSGEKLEIQFCREHTGFIGLNFNVSKDLVITVPRDWRCDTFEIDTASARVEIHDLTIQEMDFDGASGNCSFFNCSVDEIDLDTASGDIHFEGTLNTLDCDAATASCNIIVTNVPRSIKLDSASGDLDLTLPENCGFSCSLDSLSGDFSSDFATTTHNGNYIHGDGSCRINVNAMSGDVCIRRHSAANHN